MNNNRGPGRGAGYSNNRGGWGWNSRNPWRWKRKGQGRGNRNDHGDAPNANVANNASGSNDSSVPMPVAGSSHRQQSSSKPPTKRRRTLKNHIVKSWKSKLPGYKLYYPESPPEIPDIDKKIGLISEYLHKAGYVSPSRANEIETLEYFEVICEKAARDSLFVEGWPSFLNDLQDNPSEIVNLWGAVMHKEVTRVLLAQLGCDEDVDSNKSSLVGRIHAGLLMVHPVTRLSDLNSFHLGKLLTVRGQVVNIGIVRPVLLQMPFVCKYCETEFVVDQPYGIFTLPKKCGVSEECDNRSYFEPKETSDNLLTMDSRKIKIQDTFRENSSGLVPKTIECELTSGLVNICNTGDTVTITGIIKMKKEMNYHGEQSLHNIYIEVVALKNHNESERTLGGHWFAFSNKDYCCVREIYDTPNVFKLLVASLCPSIYGHDFVKAALLLSLFGGSGSSPDEILNRRGDINLLLIGDPGIGKSQMLKIVSEVAPRGVYVCGTGSTVAGLTVTLVKDGDEYSLEAGALVMGDRGVCCIDEFDKMSSQHLALLEAMEQQSVSIAKSGVYRTLPARTTVIAAANPIRGHYDQTKTVNENIKISAALLSRFDITFILLDKPNKDFDRRMVEHIIGMRKPSSSSHKNSEKSEGSIQSHPVNSSCLLDRLKVMDDEQLDLIPHILIRKYVAYARQYVRPKISAEAGNILKEYFLCLRVKHKQHDATPVTTRQLESLVRLTQARAKVELREVATAQDARDVLEIFESSLSSAFDDELIAVSVLSQSVLVSSGASGRKSGAKSELKRLVMGLQKVAETQCKNTFTVDEIRESCQVLGLSSSVNALIAKLNFEGYLLKKGSNLYQLLTADY